MFFFFKRLRPGERDLSPEQRVGRGVVLSHHTALSAGLGILLSKAFTPTFLRVEHVVLGRFLLLEADFNGFTVVFMNIYTPTNGAQRRLFLEAVSNKLQNHKPSDYLFLGGDFNCMAAQ